MQPTRRQVLLGGLVLTAACTTEPSPRPATPSRDELLRAEAVEREQALVDAYLAALHERPELSALLAPLLGDHAAHLAALGGRTGTSGQPSPSAPPLRTAPPRPGAVLLRALAAQESAAAAAHAGAAELAGTDVSCDRALAPLLASLAASEASHLVVL